jgi:3-oxoacyl-[acyl-carrier protein] reductase
VDVAIVTGGSVGIGREIARTLAGWGYAIVVVYLRDQVEAEAAVDDILAADGTAVAVRADVGDELDVERLFDESAAAFGGVDVVVHTAVGGTAEVNRQAARRLRAGGTIVDASGTDHDVAEVVALLDRWRRGQNGSVP